MSTTVVAAVVAAGVAAQNGAGVNLLHITVTREISSGVTEIEARYLEA